MKSLQIEYFFALVNYQNFSEVARRLYVAQPAISKQIAALEEELGIRLFLRKPGKVELTQEGKIMYDAFMKIRMIFDDAKKEALENTDHKEKLFKIAIIEGIDLNISIVEIIKRLKCSFPNVNFKVESLLYNQIVEGLKENKIDLAITCEEEKFIKKDLRYILLEYKPIVLIVAAAHPLAQKNYLDFKLLRTQKIYVTDVGTRGFKNLCSFIHDQLCIPQENLFIVPSIETMVHHVDSGLGATILYENHKLKANPNIKFFPIDGFSPMGIYATWNPQVFNKLERVRDTLIEELIKS